MLKVLHGESGSLNGKRFDFWGDAMSLGGTDFTRLGVRYLTDNESNIDNPSNAQSSSHIFCFAAFKGKDTRENLARNLGCFETLGKPGLLYKVTESLREQGAILTVTGDSPFLNHLLTDINSDNSKSCSKLPMYIREPCEAEQIEIIENMAVKAKKDPAKYDPMDENPEEYMRLMREKNAVFPHDAGPDGRRSGLKIDLIDELSPASLICVASPLCACPDPPHQQVRIVEAIMQRIAQNLVNGQEWKKLRKLERNISRQGVKFPNFRFEIVTGSDSTTKSVKRPSFSGENAMIILADYLTDMPGARPVMSLFNGVYKHTDPIGQIVEGTPTGFLNKLQPHLKVTGIDKAAPNKSCFSRRTLSEAHLAFLRDAVNMLRSRTDWDEDKKTAYKKAVDSFYLATLVLFTGDAYLDFTPYMLKLDLIVRLLEHKPERIRHIWNHMGEAGEKSHHHSQKLYHSKTMRNGGRGDRNNVSEFTNILFSYIGICRVATTQKKSRTYEEISNICKELIPVDSEVVVPTYLDICRDIPVEPKLDIGKTYHKQQLRGLLFSAVGSFPAKHVQLKENEPLKRVTQKLLHKIVIGMAGTFVPDMAKKGDIMFWHPGHFCLVSSQECLEKLITDTTEKSNTHKGFQQSLKGPWIYVSHNYLLDCYKQDKLLDPETFTLDTVLDSDKKPKQVKIYKYLITSDKLPKERLEDRPMKHICHLLAQQQRPEGSNNNSRSVMSAFKRHHASISGLNKNKKVKGDPRPRMYQCHKPQDSELATYNKKKVSARAVAYNRFRSAFMARKNAEIREERSQLQHSRMNLEIEELTSRELHALLPTFGLRLNSEAANEWKSLSDAEQEQYFV